MSLTLDPSEVAKILDVSVKTLAYWRWAHKGPAYIRLSERKFRYHEADVQRYIDERRIDPSARARLEKTHYASR